MRSYESLVIFDATVEETDHDNIISKVEETITKANGVVESTDKWGKRRLAYEINKQREGYYVLFNFKANKEIVKELDEVFRFTPVVLRAMTTISVPQKAKTTKIQ